jgi:7-carboxy-7-deazaguanine synthase
VAWFIRLGGCNLRCAWCDTEYAWSPGQPAETGSLIAEAVASGAPLVVVTGGEPLLQAAAPELIGGLCDAGLDVMVETNGTQPVASLDARAVRILDVKPPSAEAAEPFFPANLATLRPQDELKFLVADRADFDFAVDFVMRNDLIGRCHLLVSPVFGVLNPTDLADWVIAVRLGFRLQMQLHKMLWGEAARGR